MQVFADQDATCSSEVPDCGLPPPKIMPPRSRPNAHLPVSAVAFRR
jgi:hypothetical protein